MVFLAIGTALYLHHREIPFIEPVLIGIALLTAILIGLWYIFLTDLPWRRRVVLLLISGATIGAFGVAVAKLTRIEGSIGGSGIPRLVWKWAPRQEGTARPLELQSALAPLKVDSLPREVAAAGYPQFLGPHRTGVLPGPALLRNWAETPPKLLWRQPIGLAWSSFAVSGTRAITQEQRGDAELVVCYEAFTGGALWAYTNKVRFSETLGGDGPRATPTIHHGRVYAVGATGILDCLDELTGRLIWSRDVLRENNLANISWGKSCSPLIVGSLVIVTGGQQHEKSLLAYDAAEGTPVWQAGRDRASYASPVLGSLAGVDQIVSVNAGSVSGHNPRDGQALWEYPWPGEYAKASQPLIIDSNRVFLAAGYGIGCVMLKVRCSSTGKWETSVLWKNRNLKPKFANVVRRGHHVYGLDDGVLACVSLDDGARKWKQGNYGHGQILLIQDLLLVQAERGEVVLLEISPQKPNELARLAALQGKTWNNPAVAGDLLFVRNDREAACYRLPLAANRVASARVANFD